jgi:Ca2+-binding RTX toxin-like protein
MFEVVRGGNDNITGTDASEIIKAYGGNDIVKGLAGNDEIHGGEGNDNLQGQDGDDTLDGGDGSDALYGGNGDDTLRGGTGTGDYLSGDAGNDTYLFSAGMESDTVNNYDTQASSIDIARFEDVPIEDLWFSRTGNNLQIVVAGTDDKVTINHWYSNANYQLDQIEVGSSVLLNNQVEQLVSAMASYSTPNGAGNVIPQDVKDELQPLLTEVWQTM